MFISLISYLLRFLKRVLLISTFCSFLISFSFFALASSPPQKINLQAVLLDAGGNVMLDLQQADIEFSIIDGSQQVHYFEVQRNVPVVSGAISVLVGNGFDTTGQLTGGIPYQAFDSSTGTRLLRMKLVDQSVSQEEFELVSVPYSYYSQYAVELTQPITSEQILNGSITQQDLHPDLLSFLSTPPTTTETTTSNSVDATQVMVAGTFENMPSGHLLGALQAIDQTVTLQNQDITNIVTGGALNNQYLRVDGSNFMLADLNMNNHNVTSVNQMTVSQVSANTLDTQTLEASGRIVCQAGSDPCLVINGNSDFNGSLNIDGSIVISGLVDGVDVSELQNEVSSNNQDITNLQSTTTNIQNQVNSHETRLVQVEDGSALDDRYVEKSGDILTGDLAMDDSQCEDRDKDNDGNPDSESCLVDGVDVSELFNQVQNNNTTVEQQINNNQATISNIQSQTSNNSMNITEIRSDLNEHINTPIDSAHPNGNLPTSRLTGFISRSQIAEEAIDSEKIANGSVDSVDVTDGGLKVVDLAPAEFIDWDKNTNNDLTHTTQFSGDVSGTYNNLTLNETRVREIVSNDPASEFVVRPNATEPVEPNQLFFAYVRVQPSSDPNLMVVMNESANGQDSGRRVMNSHNVSSVVIEPLNVAFQGVALSCVYKVSFSRPASNVTYLVLATASNVAGYKATSYRHEANHFFLEVANSGAGGCNQTGFSALVVGAD